MSESQYYAKKEKEQNKTIYERIEDKFFDSIEKLLPEKHKVFVEYLRLAYVVNKCRISFHLSNPKTVYAVSAVSLAVFFCPKATTSCWDFYFAAAFLNSAHFISNR
jgi:hypothetical protein